MIENVFTLAVQFKIGGSRSCDIARFVLKNKVARQPTASATDRVRILKRLQECVRNERIEDRGIGICTAVPLRAVDGRNGGHEFHDGVGRGRHVLNELNRTNEFMQRLTGRSKRL